jgi:hypothetical protein
MPAREQVPKRSDSAAPIRRYRGMLAPLAAMVLAVLLASAPMVALADGTLSEGTVAPTTGTTSDAFTFTVHYTSTGSPSQPAQSVGADVAGIAVPFTKIDGSANDGTWQATATLPAGSWVVVFHATTSADPQPTPLVGPVVTVNGPPPTPTPFPAPEPTAPPPTLPPTTGATPAPIPQPTGAGDPTAAPGPRSTSAAASGSGPVATSDATSSGTESSGASGVLEPSDGADEASPGSMLASFLIVGGTMSIAGALVLARQWYVTRRGAR